jgi:hypothetical protein
MKSRRHDTTQSNAQSITKVKLSVFAVVMSTLVAATQPLAIALDNASTASSEQPSATKPTEALDENAKVSSDLAIDSMRDIAYVLQRIRQQAINIYIECTRKPVKRYDLNIVSLSKMPTTPLESPSVYLPLRKAWLAFFIGTMEPLVQILNEHLKHIDERTKQSHLPSECLPRWCQIVSEWKNSIKELNAELTVCADLVNDSSPCNIEVAKSARSIDRQVTKLDSILHRASRFWHDNLPKSKT